MTTQGRPPQPLAQLASLLTLAAVCLVFGGCELEETCDPTLDPNCAFGGYDAGAGDGSGDGTGDGTGDGSGTEPPTPCPDGCGAGVCEDNECVYTHVLVQDISAELNGPHPGSDIDAIELISNGQSFFARTPTDFFSDATMTNDASDPSQVAGAPELAGTPFACDVDAATEHWFSLATGFVVVDFGRPIREGDQIVVYECPGRVDEYDVSLGSTARFDEGTFTTVLEAASGVGIAEVGPVR